MPDDSSDEQHEPTVCELGVDPGGAITAGSEVVARRGVPFTLVLLYAHVADDVLAAAFASETAPSRVLVRVWDAAERPSGIVFVRSMLDRMERNVPCWRQRWLVSTAQEFSADRVTLSSGVRQPARSWWRLEIRPAGDVSDAEVERALQAATTIAADAARNAHAKRVQALRAAPRKTEPKKKAAPAAAALSVPTEQPKKLDLGGPKRVGRRAGLPGT